MSVANVWMEVNHLMHPYTVGTKGFDLDWGRSGLHPRLAQPAPSRESTGDQKPEFRGN